VEWSSETRRPRRVEKYIGLRSVCVFARGGGLCKAREGYFCRGEEKKDTSPTKKKQYQISTTTNTAFTTLSPYNSQPETPPFWRLQVRTSKTLLLAQPCCRFSEVLYDSCGV
jgi:hypothetical protein